MLTCVHNQAMGEVFMIGLESELETFEFRHRNKIEFRITIDKKNSLLEMFIIFSLGKRAGVDMRTMFDCIRYNRCLCSFGH